MDRNGSNFSDFSEIIGEINRFIHLANNRKFLEIERADHLCTLPSPDGRGHFILGRKGARLFREVAARALNKDKSIRYRASLPTMKKAIEWYFVHQILKAKKQLTQQLADKIVGRACKHVRKQKLRTRTRFVPCVLTQETDRTDFWVGPVRFQTLESFFEENADGIDEFTRSVEENYVQAEKALILGQRSRLLPAKDAGWPLKEIKQRARYFEESLRDYLSSYRWIASTRLENFDDQIGGHITRISVESALNILRLFIGASHADHFRVGGDFRIESRGVKVLKNVDGTLSISTSSRSEDATLGSDWLTLLFSADATEGWVHTAGSLIRFLQSGTDMPLLYQRLVDALWWYGEAVSEPLPHAKIIRYANALEVFLGTSPTDIAHQISVRAAYLCSQDVVADAAAWFKKTKDFYDARSRLVHGRLSPLHPDVDKFVSLGDELVSTTLMEGLGWTHFLSYRNYNMKEKEISYYFDKQLPLYAFDLIFD